MPLVVQHRVSRREYHQMAETGLLTPDARVELLDGQIIDMSPIGPFHASVVKRLNHFFTSLSAGRWIVGVQDPVVLDDYSEPQPDLVLLRPQADYYEKEHPLAEDIFLLIESADSSLYYDRGRKLSAYARAGIREVWIVNLVARVLEVYREPDNGGFGSTTVLGPGAQASPLAFPDVAVDVAKLLKA